MALTIDQITAASYPAVLTAMRKPANQWAENALMRAMEKQGAVERKAFGPTLEETLDYRRNPDGAFLATDMTAVSNAKTEVLTAASYAVGMLAVPITWSEADDVKNPTENQKVALVKSLLENGIQTHDDLIEQALFAVSTSGFLGFQTVLSDTGLTPVGGIDPATEAWWANQTGTYALDGSDIQAALGTAYDAAMKGSGSSLKPTLIFSGVEPFELYMASLQDMQRFVNTSDADASFTTVAFREVPYVFSHYGGARIYGTNKKAFRLLISSDANRKLLEKIQLPTAVAWNRKIFSALQLVTNNRSRGFVLTGV